MVAIALTAVIHAVLIVVGNRSWGAALRIDYTDRGIAQVGIILGQRVGAVAPLAAIALAAIIYAVGMAIVATIDNANRTIAQVGIILGKGVATIVVPLIAIALTAVIYAGGEVGAING